MKLLTYFAVYSVVFLYGIAASQELPQLHIVDQPDLVQDGLVSADIRDANGRICAGIMVVSDMVGFVYESHNGVVKVSHTPGQDIVYVSPDERVLEVYFSGFEPLKIILSEHGIDLETKRIWRIKITGDIVKVGTGNLSIETVPAGFHVLLNGAELASKSPVTLNDQPAVEYRIEIDGGEFYVGCDTTLMLPKDKTTRLSFEPVRKTGALYLATTPTGTEVYLDDRLIGTTPLSEARFPTGDYTLRLVKRDYDTYNGGLSVNWNETTEVTFSLSTEGTSAWKQRRATAIKRSLILPGGGQLVSGQSKRGWAYMGLFIGSATIAVKSYIDFNSIKKDYESEVSAYESATLFSEINEHYDKAQELYPKINPKKQTTETFALIAAGIYVWQLIDVLVWGGGQKPTGSNYTDNGVDIQPYAVMNGEGSHLGVTISVGF